MKKNISFIIFLLFTLPAFCQEGVIFNDLTFTEALAKAKAENKMVFMDCYTAWCGPCKTMLNKVFIQKKAGDYFNPRFICVKYDMEKGEGIELAKQFGIKSFPTFLMIRPDGSIQHKIVSSGSLDNFISWVERGFNEKTSLDYLNKEYAKGKMSKKRMLLYQHTLLFGGEREKEKQIRKELTEKLNKNDKLKKEYWFLVNEQPYGSDDFHLVLKDIDTFRKKIGERLINNYLSKCFTQELDECIIKHDLRNDTEALARVNKISEELSAIELEKKDHLILKTKLANACAERDGCQVIILTEQLLPNSNGNDTRVITSALTSVGKNLAKEELSRMIALGDKLIAKNQLGLGKEKIKNLFEDFRVAGHTGVYFRDLTLEQALEKAKKEQKMLFVDCYTSWCGPCKLMTKEVFSQEKAGEYFNKKFICVKYDMEKGEGPALLKRYDVKGFPTFLVINPDGTIRHKYLGGADTDLFIAKIDESFDDNKAFGALESKYNNGNRDKELLHRYMTLLEKFREPKAFEVADEFFKSLSDDEKTSQEYWFIYENTKLSSKTSVAEKYLQANRDKFYKAFGKEKIDARLSRNYRYDFLNIFTGKKTDFDINSLDETKLEIKKLKLNDEPLILSYIAIAKAIKQGNIDRLLTTCEREFAKMPKEKAPLHVFKLFKKEASAEQTARWNKLKAKYS